ncbi:GntR family transcriptional regulator [Phytoactinopolyspora endophytica]|uniref:GntR family transcriptional regulator n=1 Tax=Phytoactinopolyspora endophytica TaxID=1642495 RepID=UPI00101D3B70|nr:GntR family transcriptional regulator [Phytoactinopolyspora endophytica]
MKKYDVIARDLSKMIARMAVGEQIPSEQALAEKYQVSGMTIRRALQLLHQAGRIEGIPGRGTFVAEPRLSRSLTSISFTETMQRAGREATSKLLSASIQAATPEEVEILGLPENGRAIHVNRLRLGDGVPLCVEHATLNAERFPDLLAFDLEGSMYALLQRKYAVVITRSQFEVIAQLPDAQTATLLQIEPSTPCLRTTSVSRDQHGVPIERTFSTYRGDLYSLKFQPESETTADM